MSKLKKLIEKDCSPVTSIDTSKIHEILTAFEEVNIFHYKQTNDDVEAILNYNFKRQRWETGRFVGDLYFRVNKTDYHLTIKPRFGNMFLLNLFEEAFNIKIPKSHSEFKNSSDSYSWVKQLISLIWVQKLAQANKHGLPAKQSKLVHYGTTIKGKLNINKSKISLFTSGNVVSETNIKEVDNTVAQILKKTHQTLETYFHFPDYKNIPQHAAETIQTLKSLPKQYSIINKNSFNKISYKEIYASYKDVVNFSWLIINNKLLSVKNNDRETNGFSVFLDIAEVWELYLLNILRKCLSGKGWKVYSTEFEIYKRKAFQRKIIPDIIIEKGNSVIIFDAKYKRMKFDYFDYDRADFFQIHTYAYFQSLGKKVVCAGLLYPISKKFDAVSIENNTDSLFGKEKNEILFKVDGIDFSEINDNLNHDEQLKLIKQKEKEFLNRIEMLVSKYD